ncbi:hypothetical protein [Pontixanthobacter rizhaonensis]|nr:hypothetical protein [Pontixanthobacter rizhaonensis]
MQAFENISSQAVAAISSVAFSLIIFAAAITPANQGVLLPIVA